MNDENTIFIIMEGEHACKTNHGSELVSTKSAAPTEGGHQLKHHEYNQHPKREFKPCNNNKLKGSRKRTKSQGKQAPHYQIHVVPLEMDGTRIPSNSIRWLRTVEPYLYTFSTHAKSRWLGRSVLDVYHTEFGSYPKVRQNK